MRLTKTKKLMAIMCVLLLFATFAVGCGAPEDDFDEFEDDFEMEDDMGGGLDDGGAGGFDDGGGF